MAELMTIQQQVKSTIEKLEDRYGERLSCHIAVTPATYPTPGPISHVRIKIRSESDDQWPILVLETDDGETLPELVEVAFDLARERLDVERKAAAAVLKRSAA